MGNCIGSQPPTTYTRYPTTGGAKNQQIHKNNSQTGKNNSPKKEI
jgi:hypothetical protein